MLKIDILSLLLTSCVLNPYIFYLISRISETDVFVYLRLDAGWVECRHLTVRRSKTRLPTLNWSATTPTPSTTTSPSSAWSSSTRHSNVVPGNLFTPDFLIQPIKTFFHLQLRFVWHTAHNQRPFSFLSILEDHEAALEDAGWNKSPRTQGSLFLMLGVLRRIGRRGGRYDPLSIKRERERESSYRYTNDVWYYNDNLLFRRNRFWLLFQADYGNISAKEVCCILFRNKMLSLVYVYVFK